MITPTFNLDYKKSKAPKTTITRDMNELTSRVGNVYEAVAIISKRANQISASLKKELDNKLQGMPGGRDLNLRSALAQQTNKFGNLVCRNSRTYTDYNVFACQIHQRSISSRLPLLQTI